MTGYKLARHIPCIYHIGWEEVEVPRPHVQCQEYNGCFCAPHQGPIMMSRASLSQNSHSHIVYNKIQVTLIFNRLYRVQVHSSLSLET